MTDVMERETVRMAQMSRPRALNVTAVQECISAVMGTVQHQPLSVMAWMTVEMPLMRRTVTYLVPNWNSNASLMAAVF
jgi:hypothetical protein